MRRLMVKREIQKQEAENKMRAKERWNKIVEELYSVPVATIKQIKYVFTMIPVNETFISLMISMRLDPRDNIFSSFKILLLAKEVLPFSIVLFSFTIFVLITLIFSFLTSLQLKWIVWSKRLRCIENYELVYNNNSRLMLTPRIYVLHSQIIREWFDLGFGLSWSHSKISALVHTYQKLL